MGKRYGQGDGGMPKGPKRQGSLAAHNREGRSLAKPVNTDGFDGGVKGGTGVAPGSHEDPKSARTYLHGHSMASYDQNSLGFHHGLDGDPHLDRDEQP